MSSRRSKKQKTLKAKRTLGTQPRLTETKISQVGLHLEYLFEYGVNFKERVVTITEEIDATVFDRVDSALTEMESANKKSVTIRVFSEGGDVYAALAIVGRLESSKCNIITEGYGTIMSAATMILACGDKRRIQKKAVLMHHESSYGIEGRHTQIKAAVKQAEKEEKMWAKWMAEMSKKDEKFWYELGQNIDAYFTAEQLLKYGVIDEIF